MRKERRNYNRNAIFSGKLLWIYIISIVTVLENVLENGLFPFMSSCMSHNTILYYLSM